MRSNPFVMERKLDGHRLLVHKKGKEGAYYFSTRSSKQVHTKRSYTRKTLAVYRKTPVVNFMPSIASWARTHSIRTVAFPQGSFSVERSDQHKQDKYESLIPYLDKCVTVEKCK